MKVMLLIPILLLVFVFGYFIMGRVDTFKKEQHYMIQEENKPKKTYIRIAAESPILLELIAVQLKVYSHGNPFVKILQSTEEAELILQELADGTVDIAIIQENDSIHLDESYAVIRIPYRTNEMAAVVWNKSIHSKVRDDVIFTIEAEYCSLKCGYVDYLQ